MTTRLRYLLLRSALLGALACCCSTAIAQNAARQASLDQIANIHEELQEVDTSTREFTELEQLRQSLDMSAAPQPWPERVKTDDYDVYMGVTKPYLLYLFDQLGYTGDKIDSGETTAIPPLLVVSIGKGWADNETVQFKKGMFYRVILPLVLYENAAVLRDRTELEAIYDVGAENNAYTPEQMQRLNELALSYRVIKEESSEPLSQDQVLELLQRVDMVAPSLALVQAAHESGYGTSRFAHQGQALFGQWDWGSNTIKPEQQRQGKGNYGIRAFEQPIGSVRAYIWNLNTHRAYASFREERARQRGKQRGRMVFDSFKLADTLTSYSERGTGYTEELKGTMRYNKLRVADLVRLMEGEPIYFD